MSLDIKKTGMITMMTKNQPPRHAINQDAAHIRALSSITPDQAEAFERAVREIAPTWDVLTFDDYDGYLSILVQSAVQDNNQKAFSIVGTAQCLELFEVHEDNLTPIASFTDIDHLTTRVIDLIGQQ